MDRIYTVLNEIQKGTTSAKELFDKVNEVFKNNLVEFQVFLNNIASKVYIRFLGGENSSLYGDIILTDKGRDYLKHNKARYGLKDYSGTCKSNGQMKCKEYFITNINDLCDTCPQRTKIESVRNTMILRFETLKSVNSKEKTIKYLNERIDNANKDIIDLINREPKAGEAYRETRVGMLLSYKDCLLYYNEQLKIINESEKQLESNTSPVIPAKDVVYCIDENFYKDENKKFYSYKMLFKEVLTPPCHITFENIDGNKYKVFTPHLATLLEEIEITAINTESQKEITINGKKYRKVYLDKYLEGVTYFKEYHLVNKEILYVPGKVDYLKGLLKLYNETGYKGNSGWKYIREYYTNVISNEIIGEFGYYSGILAQIDELVTKYPELFKGFYEGEIELSKNEKAQQRQQSIPEFYTDSDFQLLIDELLTLTIIQINDFLEYRFSKIYRGTYMSGHNWLTMFRKNLMQRFPNKPDVSLTYTIIPSGKNPIQIEFAYKWENDKGIYLMKKSNEKINNDNSSEKIKTADNPMKEQAKDVKAVFAFDYSNKDNYFYPDRIEAFEQLENELLQRGFINEKGIWDTEQNILVALIHILFKLRFLKPIGKGKTERALLNMYKRFFITRYSIDITKAFQPTQFNIGSLKTYKVDFHFIPEIDNI